MSDDAARSLCDCGHPGARHRPVLLGDSESGFQAAIRGRCEQCQCAGFVDDDPRRGVSSADLVAAVQMALAMQGVSSAERVVDLVEWIVGGAPPTDIAPDLVAATRLLVAAVIVQSDGDANAGEVSDADPA